MYCPPSRSDSFKNWRKVVKKQYLECKFQLAPILPPTLSYLNNISAYNRVITIFHIFIINSSLHSHVKEHEQNHNKDCEIF